MLGRSGDPKLASSAPRDARTTLTGPAWIESPPAFANGARRPSSERPAYHGGNAITSASTAGAVISRAPRRAAPAPQGPTRAAGLRARRPLGPSRTRPQVDR